MSFRGDREVKTGYRCRLVFQERVKGVLKQPEETTCDSAPAPSACAWDWREGVTDVKLYVKGENNNKELLGLPAGWHPVVGIVSRNIGTSATMHNSCRYPPSNFGIQIGMRPPWPPGRRHESGMTSR